MGRVKLYSEIKRHEGLSAIEKHVAEFMRNWDISNPPSAHSTLTMRAERKGFADGVRTALHWVKAFNEKTKEETNAEQKG